MIRARACTNALFYTSIIVTLLYYSIDTPTPTE